MSDVRSPRPGLLSQENSTQLFVALTVVVLAQSTRPLFSIMYEIGEDWNFVLAGLVALGAFSAPLVVAVLPGSKPRTSRVGGAVLMGAGLLAARLVDPISAPVAIIVAVGALAGVTFIVAHSELMSQLSPSSAVSALVLGLAIDVGTRGVFGSWDLVWQSGAGSLVVVLALVAGLIALSTASESGTSDDAGYPPAFVWVGVGAYLLLQLLFLQNFAFVASQGEVSIAVAVLTVLGGDLLAVAVLGWGPQVSQSLTAALVVVVVVSAWALPLLGGIGVVVVVLAMQPAVSLLLARAGRGAGRRSGRRVALAIGGGSLLYLALVLLWSLHIDQPLPVPRQTLPAIAALVVGAMSMTGATGPRRRAAVDARVAIAIVLALAVAMPLWLLTWEPGDVGEAAESGDVIPLVSYNVRGSVGIDGQLAPDRIVDEILSSDPDIVVVQEAARGWPIHGTIDLVSHLQRELGLDFVYVPAADGQFGNAIFSRLPMTEVERGTLPDDGSQGRAYVVVRFDVGERPLYVAGTHLTPRSTTQVSALLDAVGDLSPLIVAGDMNIAPRDPEITLFTDAGLIDTVGATGDECRTTSAEPTSDCDRPDWVFVTPDLRIEELRIGDGGASDHLAIHLTVDP